MAFFVMVLSGLRGHARIVDSNARAFRRWATADKFHKIIAQDNRASCDGMASQFAGCDCFTDMMWAQTNRRCGSGYTIESDTFVGTQCECVHFQTL
jgi:hypothetical protein